MTSKERMQIALRGGKPDRAPIMPRYDIGYVMKSIGHDMREYGMVSLAQQTQFIEESFLRHEVDGFYVIEGYNNAGWANKHTVEKLDEHWIITNKQTGEKALLLPDGNYIDPTGEKPPAVKWAEGGGISKIQNWNDLDKYVPLPPTEESFEKNGTFAPLRNLTKKYPDHYFSFEIVGTMPLAIYLCNGYVEGLTTMASNRDLFRELLVRCAKIRSAYAAPIKKAGAQAVWFTSCISGADTISPKDYAELVFPCDYEICREAKKQGLDVLNWWIGDVTPILDKVMELPIDALVLEQGRKGYVTDPVEIRKRVGSKFCLFGYGFENDFVQFNRDGLSQECRRQFEGAGKDGAYVVGAPIMPRNAQSEAVDFYFEQARKICRYGT